MASDFNSLQNNVDRIASLFNPDTVVKMSELISHVKVLECFVSAHKSRKQYRSRADYINESNPYLFFLRMYDKLRFELSRLMDVEINYGMDISSIELPSILSDNIKSSIGGFLNASINGLHTDIDKPIPYEQKKEWVTTIFQLSNVQ